MNKTILLSLALAAVSAGALLPIGVAVSASVIAAAGLVAIAFSEYRVVRKPVSVPAGKRRSAYPLAA